MPTDPIGSAGILRLWVCQWADIQADSMIPAGILRLRPCQWTDGQADSMIRLAFCACGLVSGLISRRIPCPSGIFRLRALSVG